MYPNYYAAQHVYEEQVQDEKREIAQWRLLREAGLVRRGPVSRAACWLVCGLGAALVRTGQTLQRQVTADAAYGGGTHARLVS
jgi:hypothetical protein